MTPAARIQAAAEILDRILSGVPAEQALTGWARSSRFAGSKDRAAVRDHVFDVLRCRRSFAALGGVETGRGLMIGALRAAGADLSEVFTGQGHAPAPLSAQEVAAGAAATDPAQQLDLPDWLWPAWTDSLGAAAAPAAQALQARAPVHLRVNLARIDRTRAQARLAAEGIETRPHPAAEAALEVVGEVRGLRNVDCFTEGLVELQDAASQAVVETLPLADGMRVLDYCAGGGGKTLAMAAQADLALSAHDAAPQRMRDLPERAARAGVAVRLVPGEDLDGAGPFDLILCDAPCSGSGSWRRAPEGKWLLTPERLAQVVDLQARILADAARLVAPGGVLAYATCSVLRAENEDQLAGFVQAHPGWQVALTRRWGLEQQTDGFFVAHLTRK